MRANAANAIYAPVQKAFCNPCATVTKLVLSDPDDPADATPKVATTVGICGGVARGTLVGGCWINGVGDGPAVGSSVGWNAVADG